MRTFSSDRLFHSFHTAGTNGRLDLSLPWCASCCPINCPCKTWSGSWIARFAKKTVALNLRSSAGWMPARTGKFSVGEGRKHPVTIHKASSSMRTTTPNWCAVLSCGVDQEKSRDGQCLGICTPSGSRKLPQQRDFGGEFFAQSLEVVTESERPVQLYPKIRWVWIGRQ